MSDFIGPFDELVAAPGQSPTSMMNVIVLQGLKNVRDKLANVGWCQYDSKTYDDDDSDDRRVIAYCLSGACQEVATERCDNPQEVLEEHGSAAWAYLCLPLSDVIGAKYEEYHRDKVAVNFQYPEMDSVIKFNDAKGRTREEVLAIVDAAIALIKERCDATAWSEVRTPPLPYVIIEERQQEKKA